MLPAIEEFLRAHGGVAHRTGLLTVVSRGQLDHETRSGQLVAPFRRTWCRPWDAEQPDVRHRAALLSVGGHAAISHTSALSRWGLLDQPVDDLVHVTVPGSRSPGRQQGLRVHRLADLPRVSSSTGLRTVSRADAILSSWPMLPRADRRGPAIVAVRSNVITTELLRDALPRHSRVAGISDVHALIGLLMAGCESELEIWGHLGVFDHPGLRHGVRQRWLRVGGQRFRIDLGYDKERLAVEMDGDRWHSSPAQRELDRRRDAKLATIDWATLRFSHERLHGDVAGCRADTLDTLDARRTRRWAG